VTARPQLDERDPAEPRDWQPVSSEWARRAAREATEAAIRAAKDARNARTNRVTAGHEDDAQEESKP
jgi:hypothetical protein